MLIGLSAPVCVYLSVFILAGKCLLQMLKCQSVASNNQEEAEEEDKDVADAAASVIRKEISTQTSSSSSAAVASTLLRLTGHCWQSTGLLVQCCYSCCLSLIPVY